MRPSGKRERMQSRGCSIVSHESSGVSARGLELGWLYLTQVIHLVPGVECRQLSPCEDIEKNKTDLNLSKIRDSIPGIFRASHPLSFPRPSGKKNRQGQVWMNVRHFENL